MTEVLLSVQARETIEGLGDDAQDRVFDALERPDRLWKAAERFEVDGRTYGRVRVSGFDLVMRPLDGHDGYLIATLRPVP